MEGLECLSSCWQGGRGVDGLSIWLTSEHVSGGRWYTGRYVIGKKDAAGLGQHFTDCGVHRLVAGHIAHQVLDTRRVRRWRPA